MEHENKEKQTPIDFRCRKIIPDVEKSTYLSPEALKHAEIGDEGSKNTIASPTPEKSDRKLSSKGKQLNENSSNQDVLSKVVSESSLKSIELPEKFKTLAELFDRMCSSIRLLGLRKKLPIFVNICTQVEIMAKRKFSYTHLAQMKYVFPEAIQIEKILVHNERTLCMEPDLKVCIFFDIVGNLTYPGQSMPMALCLVFRERLLAQFNGDKDAEIPQADLPAPFNNRNGIGFLNSLPEKSLNELPHINSVEDSFLGAKHFSPSFRPHFCKKVSIPESERTIILSADTLLTNTDHDVCNTSKNSNSAARKESAPSLSSIRSLSQAICVPTSENLIERTPEKGAFQSYQSTPANADQATEDMIAETPGMQTPKRPMPTPDENMAGKTEKSLSESKTTSSVRRTLIYSPHKIDLSGSKLDFDTAEQTVKRDICGQAAEQTSDTTVGTSEAQDLNQSSIEKRRSILLCLPAMFDLIRSICRSTDCYLITKQELVHKIISNNLDIEERSQVEEQLCLLEELIPDWMCKKSTCNGESLYCIKCMPDPDSVRSRLMCAA